MPIKAENRHRCPPDWSEVSASIRFDRARGRCECIGECGTTHPGGRCVGRHGAPAWWHQSGQVHIFGRPSVPQVVLTVAHLDHQPENCHPLNLKAMCQRCHLLYDAGHHAETAAESRRGSPSPQQMEIL